MLSCINRILVNLIGLTLYVKLENPFGQRIQEFFIGKEPVRQGKVYPATFVTAQGVPEKYGTNRQKLQTRAIEALWDYLARHRPAEAGLRGTVVAI